VTSFSPISPITLLTKSFLYSLKPISRDLLSLPMQATKVGIVGIAPTSSDKASTEKMPNSDWSVETMKRFYAMVANKRLIAQVVVSA